MFILLHLFSCQNENKRLEMEPILLKVLPFVLIFRNIPAIFLKKFSESALIYPNPNITFAFLKRIFARVMRKSWTALDLVILNKLTFPYFFSSYVCNDQYLKSSHIGLKKKTEQNTHTFIVSGKIVLRGATLNSLGHRQCCLYRETWRQVPFFKNLG